MVKNGKLCQQYEQPSGRGVILQLVVPESLQEAVLMDMHEGELGGHLGVDKTISRLKEHFYLPGHYQDIQNWCGSCATCASRNNPTPSARAPLTNVKAGSPMQIVAVDLLGPFPESQAGNTYICL